MHCNEAGLDIIKRYEGLRLTAYKCPAGVWTIGYGSTGPHVFEGLKITEAQADDLLRRDVARAEEAVTRLLSVPINQNQFSALVSLVFNIGAGNFRGSTLRVLVNRKAFDLAAKEFPRWNRANGQIMAGLTKRRQEEQALFLSRGGIA